MSKYPPSAYSPAMEVYKHILDAHKPDAQKILDDYYNNFAEGDAPPYEMASKLLELVPKDKQSGLESIVENAKKFEQSEGEHSIGNSATKKTNYADMLLGGLATAFGFATFPPLGAAALLTTILMMYNPKQNKSEPAPAH